MEASNFIFIVSQFILIQKFHPGLSEKVFLTHLSAELQSGQIRSRSTRERKRAQRFEMEICSTYRATYFQLSPYLPSVVQLT